MRNEEPWKDLKANDPEKKPGEEETPPPAGSETP